MSSHSRFDSEPAGEYRYAPQAILRGVCPAGHEHESYCSPDAVDIWVGRPTLCFHGVRVDRTKFGIADYTDACQEQWVPEYGGLRGDTEGGSDG